ncbi:unnamed protein product [Choristocarpus tenellus]
MLTVYPSVVPSTGQFHWSVSIFHLIQYTSSPKNKPLSLPSHIDTPSSRSPTSWTKMLSSNTHNRCGRVVFAIWCATGFAGSLILMATSSDLLINHSLRGAGPRRLENKVVSMRPNFLPVCSSVVAPPAAGTLSGTYNHDGTYNDGRPVFVNPGGGKIFAVEGVGQATHWFMTGGSRFFMSTTGDVFEPVDLDPTVLWAMENFADECMEASRPCKVQVPITCAPDHGDFNGCHTLRLDGMGVPKVFEHSMEVANARPVYRAAAGTAGSIYSARISVCPKGGTMSVIGPTSTVSDVFMATFSNLDLGGRCEIDVWYVTKAGGELDRSTEFFVSLSSAQVPTEIDVWYRYIPSTLEVAGSFAVQSEGSVQCASISMQSALMTSQTLQ